MQKENIVDFVAYREQISSSETLAKPITIHDHEANPQPSVSKDLELAIQHLIFRLRELGPIKESF